LGSLTLHKELNMKSNNAPEEKNNKGSPEKTEKKNKIPI
jgi:hypothetical protein